MKNHFSLRNCILYGVLIRLLFMPFTAHGDIIFINYLPHLMSYHNIWDGYQYFLNHYFESFSTGHFYYPPLTYWIISISQFFLKPIMSGFDGWMDQIGVLMRGDVETRSLVAYLTLIPKKQLFLNLFSMKIVYLIFDFLGALFLWKILPNEKSKKYIMVFLIFNPIIIFGSYIQGQIDIIQAFFIIFSLFCVHKKWPYRAVIVMSIGALIKSIPLVIALPLCLILGKSFEEKCRLIFTAGLTYALFFIPYLVWTDGAVLYSVLPGIVSKMFGIESGPIEVEKLIKTGILCLSYTWILITLLRHQIRQNHFWHIVHYGTIILLLIYALIIVKPSYFIWIAPLILLSSVQIPTIRWRYMVLMIATFIYKLKKTSMCLGLFAPLNPSYFASTPGLKELAAPYFDYNIVIKSARVIFVIVSFWIIWDIVQVIRKLNKMKVSV